jgi:predicted kinase
MKPLSLSQPHLIVMIGIPGSGKSTFVERFSSTFDTPFVSQPAIQQMVFGARYGSLEEEAVATEVAHAQLLELLKTDHTIIYEDGTGSRHYRQVLTAAARKAGYAVLFVWVQTDSVEARRRSSRRAQGTVPLTAQQFDQAVERFEVPVEAEKAIVISGRHTYATQLKNVLRNLTVDRARQPIQVPRRSSRQ